MMPVVQVSLPGKSFMVMVPRKGQNQRFCLGKNYKKPVFEFSKQKNVNAEIL